jgi:hypothetical protein
VRVAVEANVGVLEVVEAEAVVQEVEELGRALRGPTESG